MALPHDRIGRESLHLHRRQPPFLDQPMTGRAEQRHPMTLRQPQITVDGHATSDAGETASLADIVLLLRGQFRQRRHHTQAHARRPLAITRPRRSEEHTSELQSLMRISYAVFCLKKKIPNTQYITPITQIQKYTRDTTQIHTY